MIATAIATLALQCGCAANGNINRSQSTTVDDDSREIFRVVLQRWLDNNDRGNSIYVAKSSHTPPESELQNFVNCVNHGNSTTANLTFEPAAKIVDSISNPRLHFINPRLWQRPDPKQINAIIEEGRPAGIISLSSVAYNQNKTIAVLNFSMYCGSLCGYGETLVLDKTNTGWTLRPGTCDAFMS